MPDAIITSTASTFGTISGTFAADQSTVTGTVSGIVPGTLSGSVGVPGPAGSPGSPGVGVPAGGTAGQYLQKIDGVDYNTDWVTLNLSGYALLSGANFTGRVTVPGITGDEFVNFPGFNIVPTQTEPTDKVDGDLWVYDDEGLTPSKFRVFLAGSTYNVATESWVSSLYAPLASPVFTGDPRAPTPASGDNDTSIANNGFGFVIVRGELENIDTSALTEGVQLYLSPTVAGAYTTTKPSAPQHLVYVGICVRAHPTLGVILVAVQNGYELDELHDVAIASKTNNDLLAYESSTDLWKNKSFGTLGLLTSADASTTYAPKASPALTGNVTITSNSTGAALFIEQAGTGNILTLHDQAADTTFVAIDQNGKINTIASSAAGGAGLNLPHGTAPTTPVNGDIWTTTTSLQWRRNGATATVANSSLANTFTAGQKQTVSHSATNAGLNIGPVAGDPSTLVNGDVWVNSTSNDLKVRLNGVSETVAEQSWVTAQSYLTSSALTPYLTSATAASTYQTISGMSSYLTTASAASTYFTIASAANKADLASPTFTGTPSLPTGTTAVTQTAGNNTTAVATTAFVTAAVPAFATLAEISAPTSTNKVVSPWDVVRMITNRASFETLSSSPVFSTSGTGAEAYKYSNDRLIWLGTPNATVSGWGQTIFETTIAANGLLGAKRGSAFNNKDFNKKIIMSGTVCFNSLGDANTVFRMMLGGRNTTTNGDPTRESVGFKVVGGGSNAMRLVTYGYNGSTSVVTETVSSFTPVVNQTFDWMIYHEPDPSVAANSKAYLYINDSLVATGIYSPSTQNVGSNYMVQTCETTASHATRMTAVIFPVKIWWSR